jgi:single-strand DNA-binding protein
MNFNQVVIGGRLTADPEVRHLQSGTAICKFSLCFNEKYKKGDEWMETAHFFDCVLFGKRGEAFAEHHSKGSEAFVHGKLTQERWEKDGKTFSKVVVKCDGFEFVRGPSDKAKKSKSTDSSEDYGDTPF